METLYKTQQIHSLAELLFHQILPREKQGGEFNESNGSPV